MSKKSKNKNKKKNKSKDFYYYESKASSKDVREIAFKVFGSTYFTMSD